MVSKENKVKLINLKKKEEKLKIKNLNIISITYNEYKKKNKLT